MGQEPELIDPNTSVTSRVNGNNFSNTGTIDLHTDWTRLFSTELGYQNSLYDYANSGGDFTNPSLAGLLNRMEQSAWLNLQWMVRPETMLQVGGRFALVNYTGDEQIALSLPLFILTGNPFYYSQNRDSRSYIGYLGFQHRFLPNLSLNAQGGFQYTEYYNDPLGSPTLTPYAVISAVYTYAPGSYAQMGFTVEQSATDVVEPDAQGRITENQQSSTVYASINQKITPKLLGTVIGRWQHSTFNGGLYNSDTSDYYNLGVNLSYSFTPHFSGEAGYNLDDVRSQAEGSYTRNRVYLGVSATY
jgi:hypothetical protein